MRSGSPRAMPSVIRDTASVIVGASSRSRASRLARLNSRVSTLPPEIQYQRPHRRRVADAPGYPAAAVVEYGDARKHYAVAGFYG